MIELERISNQIKYSYKEIDQDILIEAIYYGTKKKIWKTILTERNFMRVVKTPNKNTTTWIHFRMVLKKVFQNKYKSTFSDDPLINTLKIECDDEIVQKLIGKIYIELVNKKEDSISDLVKNFEDISKEESTSQKIYDYQTFSLKLVDMLKILSKEKVYMEDTISKMENKMYKATKDKSNNEIIKAMDLYYGIAYTQNEVRAKEKLVSSYEKGNKIAMGLLYYFGEGGLDKDYQKASEIFIEFTKKERIQIPHKLVERKIMGYCLFFVGKMYNEGNFLNKNYRKAVKYYKRSIKYDNPLAMKNLASLYDHDNSKEGIKKDINKAMNLYKRAIHLGYSGAYNNLALIYHHGKENVPKNLKKAIELYKQAIILGNPVSLNNLAHIYHYGEDGTEIKIEKAIHFYERSVMMGCTTAMINLATIYHHGQNGVSVNLQRALNLYDQSIKLGNHTCKQNFDELFNKSK